MDTQIDTAQQRAEAAAKDMYNRLISVMRNPQLKEHALQRLELFYTVARRDALADVEGLRIGMYVTYKDESSQFCVGYQQAIADALDRLREGRE